MAANLAVALTQSGKRVTLVDGDLRMPTLHTLFEADNTAGLSAVLRGSADARAALRDSGIPQLALLPAGPATQDSHQLLAGPAKATLLQSLTQQADYVVLNLPPVLGRSDALELAPLLDGVFLLLRAGLQQHSRRAEGRKPAPASERQCSWHSPEQRRSVSRPSSSAAAFPSLSHHPGCRVP